MLEQFKTFICQKPNFFFSFWFNLFLFRELDCHTEVLCKSQSVTRDGLSEEGARSEEFQPSPAGVVKPHLHRARMLLPEVRSKDLLIPGCSSANTTPQVSWLMESH